MAPFPFLPFPFAAWPLAVPFVLVPLADLVGLAGVAVRAMGLCVPLLLFDRSEGTESVGSVRRGAPPERSGAWLCAVFVGDRL